MSYGMPTSTSRPKLSSSFLETSEVRCPEETRTFFEQTKAKISEWFNRTVPSFLTYIAPASIIPSQVIPYPDLREPSILQKFLYPTTDHLYSQIADRLTSIKDYFDIEEFIINDATNPMVFTYHDLPYVFKTMAFPAKQKSFGSRVCKQAHLYAEAHDHNINRVVMAERLRQIVADYHLDMLYVPKKWLFPLKDGCELKDDQYVVIAEKLKLMDAETTMQVIQDLSSEEAENLLRQLMVLIVKSGYQDAKEYNFAFMEDGRLAVFDTEPLGNVDLSRRATVVEHRLGEVRDKEIDCALYGMEQLSSESGLPFPEEMAQLVADEFRSFANSEQVSNNGKRATLSKVSVLAHTAFAVASVALVHRLLHLKKN